MLACTLLWVCTAVSPAEGFKVKAEEQLPPQDILETFLCVVGWTVAPEDVQS